MSRQHPLSIAMARKILAETSAVRLTLPFAYADPAFDRCMHEASTTPELVEQFDRLYGCSLSRARSPIEQMIDKATGYQDDQLRKFTEFVHDSIYMRLPDDAIHALRLAALAQEAAP